MYTILIAKDGKVAQFKVRLNFRGTRTEEDETRALLPKTYKLDACCPSDAQDSLLNPSKEETDCTKKQRGQWLLHRSSHQPLEPLTQCVKYMTIVWNMAFSIAGLLIFAIGIWGLYDKESLTTERITYLGSDPMLFFVLAGLAASAMSLVGCTGALIENTCLLKLFTGGIITFVILEVLGGIVLFSLRHQIDMSLQESLMVAVLQYQDDLDLQFIMDEIQTGLQCCGVESYLDWKTNVYFNCSSPGVQACGVPASCCLDPLENGTVPNSQCGFGALVLDEFAAQRIIYLGGCVPQLTRWLSNHAGTIAVSSVLLIVIEIVSLLLATKLLAGIAFVATEHDRNTLIRLQPKFKLSGKEDMKKTGAESKKKCIAYSPGLSQAQGMRAGVVSELKWGHLNIFNHFALNFCVLLLSPSEVVLEQLLSLTFNP
ncbi:hypothetical protein JRQ81_002022 [Phrynocephalus forsythii]|uniref:Tetraspanin-10 n=1 Tax=Phrynocephalus forsythii TaxID=171643 RepID=A0A9Q0XI23_9SAUR|nr:hypothetical protein JRQ81_002022 [Phrynocephalus forsythii]